ncbi:MAG: excinuclease ABC subunit B [Flavobacteriaceae bacterium]|nr:excinuclease ABC subunit B [Flavobacteriaceae bacterium]|tara:strand:+ start:9405 stop:11405 length:2001 start_codon:yes stop_codon:yes gene_type:complete
MQFKVESKFSPTGDQPEAIKQIVKSFSNGEKKIVLQGVTGSGKTFTVANIIERLQCPTLVLAHNKTLAAQLFSEFKHFFPKNCVEYFVSYYDYYQPEAYLPTTGIYIEKDLSINEEIEKLRLSAVSSLLSGRKDVIVVASVSCIYGIGNPSEFKNNVVKISKSDLLSRSDLLKHLVQALYSRVESDLDRGNFRVKGDIVDIFPTYSDIYYKIEFYDNKVEEINSFDPLNDKKIEGFDNLDIYPAEIFVTSPNIIKSAINKIQDDLIEQVNYFEKIGSALEANRIKERTEYDIEMIKELGYCSGIENYSRYLDGRKPGSRPFCLIDYFPDDYIMIIDESHVSIPQVHAMYGGDRSRKENLVEYGFRLPSALDNRPLKFEEFERLQQRVLYVSATPANYELKKAEGFLVEQIIRPTGLLDPEIEVRPSKNQIDDLIEEIQVRTEKNERVLITTLTKRMAEELAKYLLKISIRCRYIHSDIETIERVEIMQELRKGIVDVIIGINLLREGLDLPEVSLVAILDADKEGFLRSNRSLIQTIGRAARNINGKAIMYADKITSSMKKTIDETNYRREKQISYNYINNITPKAIKRSLKNPLEKNLNADYKKGVDIEDHLKSKINDLSKKELEKEIKNIRAKMESAALDLDFIKAANLRDLLSELIKRKKNGA